MNQDRVAGHFKQNRNNDLDLVALWVRPALYSHAMEFQMPQRERIDDLPGISIDEVEPGDILFFSRKGPLQNMFWAVKDIWLHTAIAIDGPSGPRTAEVGTGPQVFGRSLIDAAKTYELTAIGRPNLDASCIAAAATWAQEQLGTDQSYAWDDFWLAALVALTRKGLPASMLPSLDAALAEVESHDVPSGTSRTCAGFVHEAYARQGNPCGIEVEVDDARVFEAMESTVSYRQLMERSLEQQDSILARRSLYELMQADVVREESIEGMHGSYITKEQLGNTLHTAFRVVSEFVGQRDPAENEWGIPGRWISPTDLWRSDQIGFQARLMA